MPQIKKEGYVYLIRTLSMDSFYIGSTHDCSQRFKNHKYLLRKGNHHCQRLQRIFNKYGFDNLIFSIIKEFPTRSESEIFEQSLLDEYFSEEGCLNVSSQAIMAAKCPFVISKRNEKLRSAEHRESASLKNKLWHENNKELAKEIHNKSTEYKRSEKGRLANSIKSKEIHSKDEQKKIFTERMKNYRNSISIMPNSKSVIRIDSNGNEVVYVSARIAVDDTKGANFKGISACCTNTRPIKFHAGFSWRFA